MKEFFTIGEISKLFKTTNRQLRFYEEEGLLIPCKIDEKSSYRYYNKDNCLKLKKILCLKDVGLSLKDIAFYFSSDNNNRQAIIQKNVDESRVRFELLENLIKTKDFELSFVENIDYLGNNIQSKSLEKLKGVWLLEKIYSNIKDAKQSTNSLNKTTPYKFLAFDKFGTSPWFYTADEQFIHFDTFYKPVKEIYQIAGNLLYLKIQNPDEHIFGQIDNPISQKHIIVFKKISENYEDYKNYLYHDEFNQDFKMDEKLLGTWKLNDDSKIKYIIVKSDGTADFCNNEVRSLRWSNGMFYDNELKLSLKYEINKNILTVENKGRAYIFSQISNFKEEYIKI